MLCLNCNKEVSTTVKISRETYPVKGDNITIEATVRYCSECMNELWDEELDSENLKCAYSEYRRRHKLLQPTEIRAIREKYSLSQTAFARVLGLGDKTVTRYENGSIADEAPNNLIALVSQPNNFAALLEKNYEKISSQDYDTARRALELCFSDQVSIKMGDQVTLVDQPAFESREFTIDYVAQNVSRNNATLYGHSNMTVDYNLAKILIHKKERM